MKRGFVPIAIAVGCGCLVLVALGFMALVGVGVFALNNEGASGLTSGTNPSGTGSLGGVDGIPESLKPVFEAAGSKFQTSPAFVAAIFYKEHGENYPETGPWASSPAGANGPFQFIEKTWEGWTAPNNSNRIFETSLNIISQYRGYGSDGTEDSKAEVQNIYDSAFSAAKLLGANGAAPNINDIETLKNVASLYNSGKAWSVGQGIPETADYVPAVITEYQRIVNQM